MYKHVKKYEIKYTDADAFDNLKLSSLLSFMEESACLSADELGFGYKDVTPLNMGFIIVNWYIQLNRPIKLGEELEVHTWPIAPKHIIFNRDYELFVCGEKVGAGTARWALIDTRDFSVLPVTSFFKPGDFDNYNTHRSVDFRGWKIPETDGLNKVYSKRVKFSDYDHYFHVNNTKYADYLIDVFSPDEFKNKYIAKVQITYVKQCKYGEEIDFYRNNDGGAEIVEGRVDGELRVQMRLELDEI